MIVNLQQDEIPFQGSNYHFPFPFLSHTFVDVGSHVVFMGESNPPSNPYTNFHLVGFIIVL